MPNLEKMLAEQAKQGEKIANIETTCIDIKQCLQGNGKPGLVVRTDRLEQKDKFKGQLFWIIAGCLIAVVVKAIAEQ